MFKKVQAPKTRAEVLISCGKWLQIILDEVLWDYQLLYV